MRFFKKKAKELQFNLYRVTFHIGRGSSTDMPAEWLGAYVTIFASENDHEAALKRMATNLIQQGYEIKGVEGKIDQLNPYEWDEYISNAWSDFPNFYPKQKEVLEALSGGGALFYSPYAGYDQPPKSNA